MSALSAEERLIALGLKLPTPLPPNGTYVPYRIVDNMLYLSGHGPRLQDNTYRRGKVDSLEKVAASYDDARLAALNILATIKMALGDLNRVQAVVRVLGMVNAAPDFQRHSKVVDGCSDLLVSVFGERGAHVRSAVGVASLPHGMTVEIEATFQVHC